MVVQEPPWSKGHPSPLDLETMSVPCELLSQCLEITLNQKAAINIRIGSDFVFSFNNQETSERKKSPSQIKRNLERNEIFQNTKKEKLERDENTLEKKIETKDSESQTDILTTTGTDTDMKNEQDSNNDKLEIRKDQSREIRPKKNETILEMRIGHDDLDETKVETYITKSLKFSLIGKPWIANNGRHFVTVGFKTNTSDYEKRKANTVNYQDSGLRAVMFSQLYQ